MHKTLRITSVIVALAAVILLFLPVVYGVRKDPVIEAILSGADAVEKFVASKDRDAAKAEVVSPLVKQATDFSRYLDPPPPPVVEVPPPPDELFESPQPISPVTAKFDLIGTSFFASRPELSLCLIDEPGKGLSWVRQGSSVGHLIIEEVKDGEIIVKDGQRKFEMTVPVQEIWKELLKNPLGGKSDTIPEMPSVDKPVSRVSSPAPGRPTPARGGKSPVTPAERIRSARDARRGRPGYGMPPENPMPIVGNPAAPPARGDKIAPVVADDRPAQNEPANTEEAYMPPPPLPTEKDIIHIRLMNEVRASRLTPEEAKQIEEAAQTIEQAEELQNQIQKARENKPTRKTDTRKPK
ncbi:MAG: hypothetical protein JW749_06495 [Sedimentisphaerales bacterium]|nr:hypothetical protein [Sedimentisphaerales bacterium]